MINNTDNNRRTSTASRLSFSCYSVCSSSRFDPNEIYRSSQSRMSGDSGRSQIYHNHKNDVKLGENSRNEANFPVVSRTSRRER
ncbi:hypothetical protein J6590_015929 [Homalodisca vitripennis]|nr:hypothetical protein J6590_015929 [Homalodisca vitripennis]